jgi:putative oxidoreductase
MDDMKNYVFALARLLMASLFIWGGIGKLHNVAGAAQYMNSVHVPMAGVTVWVIIAIETLGGLAILLGFQTRRVALLLSLFCLATGFLVHLPAGDQSNMINFYKNLVMAGGFLYVFVCGAGSISLDRDNA